MKGSKQIHLNPEELNELIELYYNSDFTIKELIELFEIENINSSRLFKFFPQIISDDLVCEFCDYHLVQDRDSRTSYKLNPVGNKNPFYCSECGHLEHDPCYCEVCVEERERLQDEEEEKLYRLQKEKEQLEKVETDKKRQFLLNIHKNYSVFDSNHLTLEQRIYLGTMLRQKELVPRQKQPVF